MTSRDTEFGTLCHQIEAAHSIGKGMLEMFNRMDTDWSTLKRLDTRNFSDKVQGSLDRKKSLCIGKVLQILQKLQKINLNGCKSG
ncbi:MAG: hypothetical protein HWD61_04065 [Parachlamydiaceae bacterium]|nr:MAG: hypothetical protein HWD61_04065 [Parachlamydiaceae bacterium]